MNYMTFLVVALLILLFVRAAVLKKQNSTYHHREIDKSGMRTPSPLRCPDCGKYTFLPDFGGCPNCKPRTKPTGSRPLYHR